MPWMELWIKSCSRDRNMDNTALWRQVNRPWLRAVWHMLRMCWRVFLLEHSLHAVLVRFPRVFKLLNVGRKFIGDLTAKLRTPLGRLYDVTPCQVTAFWLEELEKIALNNKRLDVILPENWALAREELFNLFRLGGVGYFLSNFKVFFLHWTTPSAFENAVVNLSVHPGQPKKSPDNQKYWCGCPMNNHKFSCPNSKTRPHFALFQVRTTKNLDGQPEIVTWLPVG